MSEIAVFAEATSDLVQLADAVDLSEDRDLIPGWSEKLLAEMPHERAAQTPMSSKFLEQLRNDSLQMALDDTDCVIQRFTTAYNATGGESIATTDFVDLFYLGENSKSVQRAFASLAAVAEKKLTKIIDAVAGMMNDGEHTEREFQHTITLLDIVESVCSKVGAFLGGGDVRKSTDADVYIKYLEEIEGSIRDAYDQLPND